MKLNLTKPLIVFDLETTGLDMIKDRIIQISYIKVMPDGTEDRKNLYVNPCKEIPAEVVALTGISNEDVKDAPTFKQLAATLEKEFTGCDFAGYNSNHFDVPMLAEEFLRAGIDFDFNKCRLIDAQTIFMKMERRNLAAAYKFFPVFMRQPGSGPFHVAECIRGASCVSRETSVRFCHQTICSSDVDLR